MKKSDEVEEVFAEDDGAQRRGREEVELDAVAFHTEVVADEASETEEDPDHADGERVFEADAGELTSAKSPAEEKDHDQRGSQVVEHGAAAQQVAQILFKDGGDGTGEVEGRGRRSFPRPICAERRGASLRFSPRLSAWSRRAEKTAGTEGVAAEPQEIGEGVKRIVQRNAMNGVDERGRAEERLVHSLMPLAMRLTVCGWTSEKGRLLRILMVDGIEDLGSESQKQEDSGRDFAGAPLGEPALDPGEDHAGKEEIEERRTGRG